MLAVIKETYPRGHVIEVTVWLVEVEKFQRTMYDLLLNQGIYGVFIHFVWLIFEGFVFLLIMRFSSFSMCQNILLLFVLLGLILSCCFRVCN